MRWSFSIGKNEQSARMLQSRDKWRGGKALHHTWRLSCISAIVTDPESPYARAREGVTRKQQESEPEPSVTEPLLLTVATDCGDESRGVRVDCAAHAVAKDSRSRALISSNLGRAS